VEVAKRRRQPLRANLAVVLRLIPPEAHVEPINAMDAPRDFVGRCHDRSPGRGDILRDLQLLGESPVVTRADLGNDRSGREPNDDVVRVSEHHGLAHLESELARRHAHSFDRVHLFRLPGGDPICQPGAEHRTV
jgi:hypothetical protein